jgi:hypothetical protein
LHNTLLFVQKYYYLLIYEHNSRFFQVCQWGSWKIIDNFYRKKEKRSFQGEYGRIEP